MRRLILICGCSLLLAACAPVHSGWVWSHPGRSEQERDAALAECRRLTRGEAPSPYVASPSGAEFYTEREAQFNRCMEDKGWRAKRR
jgi:hypothetical protein